MRIRRDFVLNINTFDTESVHNHAAKVASTYFQGNLLFNSVSKVYTYTVGTQFSAR